MHPLYSLIMVNNGERGIVTSMTPGKLHQPVVTLIQDPDGKSYTPPIAVDLPDEAEEAADQLIVSILDAEKESIRIQDSLPDTARAHRSA
ncbi:MAG: hypothetical protein FVQ04_07265 [Nitrospira sp.]|nr:hypothetical protein [Nitrospira sp.]